jgi:lipopolysaccharide/colanic/teichoic acid biosynthesis glycosyltransferase
LASIPLVRQGAASELNWQAIAVFERFAALVLLLLALPVIASAALILWLLSGRSPFIAHQRVGWQGGNLWMLKLRTMWKASDPRARDWVERIADEAGPSLKGARDPRVGNSFARFCRRHSIDELPQLWHVLTGEMSLVGPRPMTARELRRHYGADTAEILSVKPGLAGLWQVSGRNRLTYPERRQLDLRLVHERTLGMYFGILVRTVPEVVSGENSW